MAPPGSRSTTAAAWELASASTPARLYVADGTPRGGRPPAARAHSDPGMGVVRQRDAGYPQAIQFARAHGIKIPMLPQEYRTDAVEQKDCAFSFYLAILLGAGAGMAFGWLLCRLPRQKMPTCAASRRLQNRPGSHGRRDLRAGERPVRCAGRAGAH